MDNSTVRIRLDLAYDGTDFHGWAKQGTSDLRTVQKVLEDNLSMVLRETVELTVAGRTDAGCMRRARWRTLIFRHTL